MTQKSGFVNFLTNFKSAQEERLDEESSRRISQHLCSAEGKDKYR